MSRPRQVKSASKPAKPVKHDQGKLPYHLLPWEAVEEVVKVLAFGKSKYAARNWEAGFDWYRMFSASIRHLTLWWTGEDLDPESGLHHLAHAACDCLFGLSFVIWKRGVDDRPIKEKR